MYERCCAGEPVVGQDSGSSSKMTTRSPTLGLSDFIAMALAAACSLAAQAQPSVSSAIEVTQPGWKIVHCGVSKGVLYLTYVDQGKAAIAPAFMTAAIRRACAEAGYPLAASASGRAPLALPNPRIDIAPATPAPRTLRPKTSVDPTFVAQASGSVISIEGRNDGETTYHCVLNFSWTSAHRLSHSHDSGHATGSAGQSSRVHLRPLSQRPVRRPATLELHCNRLTAHYGKTPRFFLKLRTENVGASAIA
jgi:hypothetical protein